MENKRIRVTLDLQCALTPGEAAEQVIQSVPAWMVVLAAKSREIMQVGRKSDVSPAIRSRVLAMRNAGVTFEAIGLATGLSKSAVQRICQKDLS